MRCFGAAWQSDSAATLEPELCWRHCVFSIHHIHSYKCSQAGGSQSLASSKPAEEQKHGEEERHLSKDVAVSVMLTHRHLSFFLISQQPLRFHVCWKASAGCSTHRIMASSAALMQMWNGEWNKDGVIICRALMLFHMWGLGWWSSHLSIRPQSRTQTTLMRIAVSWEAVGEYHVGARVVYTEISDVH